MKWTLNTWQRIMLCTVVGSAQGNAAVMRKAIKAMDALELTPEEAAQVGMVALPNGNLTWQETGITFDIEIKDKEVVGLVKALFTRYDKWDGSDARRVIGLEATLGIKEPPTKEE